MMLYILLSTYNGARYLEEQLDSILCQTFTEWILYARDDGSTDTSVDILQRYATAYPDKIFIDETGEKGMGAMRSFEYLLARHGDADYFAFSDQDDVWKTDKLEVCTAEMAKAEARNGADKPIVVHTDLEVVDEQLKLINPSFWQYGGIHPEILDTKIQYLAICNSVTGCAMLMNRAAKEIVIPFPPHVFMHDAWIGIRVLASEGIVVPISQATVYYRQHGDNVCGAQRYRFRLTNLQEKYEWAERSYQTGHPLVFRNLFHFIWCKTSYFIVLHTL